MVCAWVVSSNLVVSLKYISFKKVSCQRRYKTKAASMRKSRDAFKMRQPIRESTKDLLGTHTDQQVQAK
jgi:hypothetical protein